MFIFRVFRNLVSSLDKKSRHASRLIIRLCGLFLTILVGILIAWFMLVLGFFEHEIKIALIPFGVLSIVLLIIFEDKVINLLIRS